MGELLPDYCATPIQQRKRILKLFRKRATADGSHVQKQTILRIFQAESAGELDRRMDALTDNAGRVKSRSGPAWLVASNTAASANQQRLASVRVGFSANSEN